MKQFACGVCRCEWFPDCHQCFALAMVQTDSLTQTFVMDIFSPSLSFLFPSFSFLYVCFWWTKEKNIFPGNLLYLQSSDMAARPLLINSPLNFNRLIINYWGINVQIQLCCPSSVHKCQQRYFMAYAIEYSDSQSPLTLTSQLSEAEKRGFFKLSMQTEQERRRNLS